MDSTVNPGAPLNAPYLAEYIKSLYADRLVAGKTVSQAMKEDPA